MGHRVSHDGCVGGPEAPRVEPLRSLGGRDRGPTVTALARLVAAELDAGRPVCTATVSATRRSVPRRPGAKMVVLADGRTAGSVGGGEMESRVIRDALAAIADGVPRTLTFALVDPSSGDPGVCGGEVDLYLEPHMPDPTVYVIGCGHVGQAVVALAHWMGFRVVAVDDRPEMADPAVLPLADTVVCGSVTEAVEQVPVGPNTDVVLVTRNVGVDLAALPVLLAAGARSVGVMGSKRRWATTRAKLEAEGVDPAALDTVRSPIGLEVGAETPEEIALSILAEIVASRRLPPAATNP